MWKFDHMLDRRRHDRPMVFSRVWKGGYVSPQFVNPAHLREVMWTTDCFHVEKGFDENFVTAAQCLKMFFFGGGGVDELSGSRYNVLHCD